jgi:hypothetical protein
MVLFGIHCCRSIVLMSVASRPQVVVVEIASLTASLAGRCQKQPKQPNKLYVLTARFRSLESVADHQTECRGRI